MKRIINISLLLPLLAAAVTSCTKDGPIEFDIEKPMFETNPNAILLEVILPTSSAADDNFYIVGDFNGGEAAIGDAAWRLEKAEGDIAKWGIYLIPSTFTAGKSLADGFYFHSEKQGNERSARNETVSHKLDVSVGTRSTVWVAQWEAYFTPPPPPKEFYTIYVEKPAEWEAVRLYMWYDNNGTEDNPLGGWPGGHRTGQRGFGTGDAARIFEFFQLPKELNDKSVNFIFTATASGPQTANIEGIVMNQDLYYTLTADANYEVVDPNSLGEPFDLYNGHTIYVDDQTGWGNLAVYGDFAHAPIDPNATFPGWTVQGTHERDGVTYKYFQPGEAMNNQTMNIWFNDTARNGQEIAGPKGILLDHDLYFVVTTDGYEMRFEGVPHNIYVENLTGWSDITLHYWGDAGGTDWPGLDPARETNIGGRVYSVFELPETLDGLALNFILNNKGGGTQLAANYIESLDRDYFYTAPANPVHDVTLAEEIAFKVYVNDQTGWDALALYAWGDFDLNPWPGLTSTGTKTVGSITYKVFELPIGATTKNGNLIFNNNNNGVQFDGPVIIVDRDFYFTITASAVTVTVWVDDQSGWDALALYAWGDYEFGGGWPGLAPTGTETAGSVTYTLFQLPADAYGKNENLIFNNNNNGSQFDGPAVKITGDLFYRITDSAATEIMP